MYEPLPRHAIAPAWHVAALWHRLGCYLSHADQRAATTLRAKPHNRARRPRRRFWSFSPLWVVIEGDHVPTIWVAGFNACAELEKPAQIIGVAPGLADQPAGDVVE